ncbi:MAG: DNA polymerase [Pyrinomonadaceae bacterium]
MEIYFQVITESDALQAACEKFANEKVLGFDTETTELDPFDGSLRLVQFSNGSETIVIDLLPFAQRGDLRTLEELAPLRELIESTTPLKVAHNAKFDAKWVYHHLGAKLGGVFDTYLASQLIAAGETDRRHGLADVANFFLGTELDKSEQVSDWSAEELSHSQIEYAAKDAATMVPLFEKINESLFENELVAVAKIENECVTPIAVMEQNGFYLDADLWRAQIAKTEDARTQIGFQLQEMLSAGVAQASLFGVAEINLNSQIQVRDALQNLGVPIVDSTNSWKLQPLAKEYPVIEKLIEYRHIAKAVSGFGENYLEFIRPETGRIHADFRQIGAPSGRLSCSKPNIQQIPHDSVYRSCFRAETGKKLIVADYSQIELRILAEFSGDESFIKAFESGEDFHAATAAQVFGIDAKDVTADQRTFAKRLNFGVVYGIGAQRFATMTGVTEREAEDILRRYFATYSGLDEWLRNAGNNAVNRRQTRTASGRLVKFRFDETDRAAVAATKRYGKNVPIQGTSADILKRALFLIDKLISGSSAKLVNNIHDEVVVEVEATEAERTAQGIETAMKNSAEEFVKKVPIRVDVKISDSWEK